MTVRTISPTRQTTMTTTLQGVAAAAVPSLSSPCWAWRCSVSAGAFAYRSMFGGSMLPTLPPIIKASDGPNKIVPNTSKASPDSQANATTPGAGEKLVSREEQPVDIDEPSKAPPRVVSTIPVRTAPQGSARAGRRTVRMRPAPSAAQRQPAPAAASRPVHPSRRKSIPSIIRSDQAGGAEAARWRRAAHRGFRFALRIKACRCTAAARWPKCAARAGAAKATRRQPRRRPARARHWRVRHRLGSSSGAAAARRLFGSSHVSAQRGRG